MIKTVRRKFSRAQVELLYQVDLIRNAGTLPALGAADQEIVNACRKDGAYITTLQDLGFDSTPQMLETAHQYLRQMTADFTVDYSRQTYAGSSDVPVYPYTLTVTYIDPFIAWANELRLFNTLKQYIGLPVAFQGVQLQRDFPNERQVFTEQWHQDAEDHRMIKVIVYLSDVEVEHGPFEYIPRTLVSSSTAQSIRAHIAKSIAAGDLGLTDREMEQYVPRSAWKPCTGKAGTVIFVDTKAVFHHGKPRTKERSALFYVYTSNKPLHPEFCQVYHDDSFIKPAFSEF